MDPNGVTPSPPSTVPSSPSAESLRSTKSTPSSPSWSPKSIPPTARSVPKLPIGQQLEIFDYTQKQLESIIYDILEEKAPAFLEENLIECKQQVELNWACRHILPHLPKGDRQSFNDWIPDVRHHATHRNIMTATAACKTMDEAAKFAISFGYSMIGQKLRFLTFEMNSVRHELQRYGVSNAKELPAEAKKASEDRLVNALETARIGAALPPYDDQALDDDVLAYTIDDKIKENPWSNPVYWGQDKNRNYVKSWSSKTSPSSASSEAPKTLPAKKDDTSCTTSSSRYVPPARRETSWKD